MRFVTFQQPGKEPRPGLLLGDAVVDLAACGANADFADMNAVIRGISEEQLAVLGQVCTGRRRPHAIIPLADVRLCAPIMRPLHDILCVGVNYRAHLEETIRHFDATFPEPERPVFFTKRTLRVTGPDEPLEAHAELDVQLDYEVELAVVLGKGGRDIAPERVAEHIFGYTIVNDVSARALQRVHGQWFRGKSLDGFAAMGPCIVHAGSMPFPPLLGVRSRVNGELRQDSCTSRFLVDIPHLVAELSLGMTLEAGDIIATGTPSGVGMGFDPPRYMQSGDVVECEIDAIGILRNTIH